MELNDTILACAVLVAGNICKKSNGNRRMSSEPGCKKSTSDSEVNTEGVK